MPSTGTMIFSLDQNIPTSPNSQHDNNFICVSKKRHMRDAKLIHLKFVDRVFSRNNLEGSMKAAPGIHPA
jgi:hypothetical protein